MTRQQRRVGVVFGALGWVAFICMVGSVLAALPNPVALFGVASLGSFTTAVMSSRDVRLR
jgi:hypothetical protein